MRRKHNEAVFGEASRESLVIAKGLRLWIFIDNIGRHTFEAVLANHHGPLLAGFDVFRNQQVAPGINIRENIQLHLITQPALVSGDVERTRTRIERQRHHRKFADDFFPQVRLKRPALLVPLLG